jgi:nucleotide-binding universal stress UspA family protein
MTNSSTHRLLVGLDLTSMDDYLLSFLNQNHEALTTEKIYFIHIEEDINADKYHTNKLAEKIEDAIAETNIEYDVRLISGDSEKQIRNWSTSSEIDLVVLGHKRKEEHEVEVKKLVKKPGCSLLLVPKKNDYRINKIAIAVDFSSESKLALKEAESISDKIGAELIGFYAYQVPTGYHYTGKDHKEFAEVMEDHARKDAEEFLKKANLSHIKMAYKYDEKEEPAECIASFVQENNVDMLVMGSKGRTSAASVLIGSVAKEITQKVNHIPLMIIKKKDERMDVVDALKKV